jgi:hypothetical protein
MTNSEQSLRRKPASTVLITVLFLLSADVHALSCASRHFTLREAFEAADSIIVGVVTGCRQEISSDGWTGGGDDCSFVAVDVLKESKPPRDYSGMASSSGCGLSLHVGSQYLLFLDEENRPMHFSAALEGDRYPAQLPTTYARILRAFRAGTVTDLSEPWIVEESEHGCWLRHSVSGNRILFSRRKPGSSEPGEDWTCEAKGATSVCRSRISMAGASPAVSAQTVEVVVTGAMPEYSAGTQVLTVSMPERPAAPLRQATLTVGSRSWPLRRIEIAITLPGMSPVTTIEYRTGGEAAEQILAALIDHPADIVVSAAAVSGSEGETAPGPELSAPDEERVPPALPDDAYFGPAPPESDSARRVTAAGGGAARPYGTQRDLPEPALRMETRSTQLPAVIEDYRACY